MYVGMETVLARAVSSSHFGFLLGILGSVKKAEEHV